MAKRFKKRKRPEVVASSQLHSTPEPSLDFKPKYFVLLLKVLLIVAAGCWIYGPVLHGDWLWDDDFYFASNPILSDPIGLWKIWFVPGSFVEYYPILATAQWIEWHLWHNATLGYHLTSLLLHLLSALLVWRLLDKLGLRLAWLGGLIFAIHPVQVESVAWIAELKNTLSLPPFLLAMGAWIDYENHHRKRDYLLALGLFLVAMLCKISMALFPLVILLYAWWKRGRVGSKDLISCAPFAALSLVLGMTTVFAGDWYRELYHMPSNVVVIGDAFFRITLAGLSLSFYFRQWFWPFVLLPIYPQWSINPPSLLKLSPWFLLAGVIYWLWTRRKSWGRHALLGLGFFIINLLPFLGFNTVSYMAFTWVMDHFLYLPSIGLIGLVIAALGQVEQMLSASWRIAGIGVMVLLLGTLAFISRDYAKKFINQEVLWTYTVQHNPEAFTAYNNLGLVLLGHDKVDEAIPQFQQSLRLNPLYADARDNLGVALMRNGKVDEAMAEFQRALEIYPESREAGTSLGDVLVKKGQVDAAILQFQKVLAANPTYAKAHNSLGNLFLRQGQIDEAMMEFQKAVDCNSNYAEAENNLGITLFHQRRVGEAINHYQKAVDIKPDYATAYNNLGIALGAEGELGQAANAFKKAIDLKPGYNEARYNLAKVTTMAQGKGAAP